MGKSQIPEGNEVLDYIKEDLAKLTPAELTKVYKFVRKLISGVGGP